MNWFKEFGISKNPLFLRRALIVLSGAVVLGFILHTGITLGNGNNRSNSDINETIDDENNFVNDEIKNQENNIIIEGNKTGLTNLGSNYNTDGTNVFYKGELVNFVNADDFVVLGKREIKKIAGTLINSDNLLLAFQDYDTRLAMMNTIDDIILNEKNVTSMLKDSSENGMYKIRSDYQEMSEYNRKNQEGILTPEQRAKFAVVYLYIKVAKNAKGTVYMEQALNELKDFLENFDPSKLKTEVTNSNFKIKGDIGMDKHCIFVDGKLYACFLDEIF